MLELINDLKSSTNRKDKMISDNSKGIKEK